MPLTDDDVREILRIIDESDLDELRIETDGFCAPRPQERGCGDGSEDGDARSELCSRRYGCRACTLPPLHRPHRLTRRHTDGLETVASPMLGTFYRAEAPGAAPFVEVGAAVEPETTVCIIEVMKMMNSVPAGVSGTIAEICTENGQLVEYGDPLFRVMPEG